MHKSRLGCLVIDCQDGDLVGNARFWSAALGYEIGATERHYVELIGPAGEVKILIQSVEHPSRVHIDIETNDQEAEIKRIEALGGARVADIRGWTVMEAPSGHRFCIVKPQRQDFEDKATVHESSDSTD